MTKESWFTQTAGSEIMNCIALICYSNPHCKLHSQ